MSLNIVKEMNEFTNNLLIVEYFLYTLFSGVPIIPLVCEGEGYFVSLHKVNL